VEAVHLDRNFIGCEIDTSYFNIAKERIERAVRAHSFKKEELF
jgi:DNA modification methylase